MTKAILDEFKLLESQIHKNIATIPIKTPKNYAFDILTLKKGFELGLAKVKECEHSTVNTLIVENNSTTPLLLVDGEEIVGGDQNRIVNSTILISPQSEMKIPVNCTEHGRWGYKHEFKESEYIANYRTRSAKAYAIRDNMDVQTAVWDSIDDLETDRGFSSPTQAMSESYENAKQDLDDIVKSFDVADGQTGIIVIIDGEMKGFELFFNSELYKDYHKKILKSYLIDAEITDSVFAVNTDEAKAMLEDAFDGEFKDRKCIGLEKSYDFENEDGIGSAYTYKDEIIHMSYFRHAEQKQDEVSSDILIDEEIKL